LDDYILATKKVDFVVMVLSYRVDFNEDGIALSHIGKSTFESIIFYFYFFRVIRGHFGLKIGLLKVLRVFLSYF
jgi:hypothetical protein